MSEEKNPKEDLFAVLAESKDYDKPLILTGLTFARLIDDVVYPYEEENPFFIDGVPLIRSKINRLKIIKESDWFEGEFTDIHWRLRRGKDKKIIADQYDVRMQAFLREAGEDVTSQIIKAYSQKIKPSIKDYIPKRKQLIKAAMTLFIESIKALSVG